MIKIEVRIRQSLGDATVEHEYRAELPDDATAEQIKAVGAEAERTISDETKDELLPEDEPPIQMRPQPSRNPVSGRP